MAWPLLAVCFGLMGCIGTDLVDDIPIADARIDITPQVAAVEQGNTLRIEATYFDGFGMAVPNVTLRWESSVPTVATVDAEGLVSGLDVGQAMIVAHTDEVSSPPVLITVVSDPNAVARVTVTPDTLVLPLGTTHTFTAEAFNLTDDRLDGKTFMWASSNPEVASIEADGTALALNAGVTEITATTDGITGAAAYLIVPGRSRQGMFVKRAGSSYQVDGTVTVEELPSGGLRIALGSDFNVSAGPGLELFLSNSTTVGSGSFKVENLRSTSGEQTYFVSAAAGLTVDSFNNVVIHCVPFNVTFGHAALQ